MRFSFLLCALTMSAISALAQSQLGTGAISGVVPRMSGPA